MEPVATDDMIRSDPGEEEAERTARFSILLVCMLVGLMLAPLFGESDTGFTIARIVGVLILVAALSVVGVHRLAIVLFVPTLVVQLVGHRSNVPIVVVTSVILRALFLAYVTGVIVWHVLRNPRSPRMRSPGRPARTCSSVWSGRTCTSSSSGRGRAPSTF